MSILRTLVLMLVALVCFDASASELNIKMMISSGNQRKVFVKIIKKFKKENPNIKVVNREAEQEKYKQQFESWLKQEKGDSDVLFWFAGAKLNHFVKKGWVRSLNDLWKREKLAQVFTEGSRTTVLAPDNHEYGIPLSYYQWGYYYRKSLFKKHGLNEPKTWDEFLKVCDTLKKNGVTPITLGSKWRWTAAAYFDYFNLRLNGLDYHRKLMDGKISYKDKGVQSVFNHWKKLVDNGYFIKNHNKLDWRGSLPYLYRKSAGLLLMGNFLIPKVPKNVINDLGFFRFPQMNPSIPYYEEAPMDILLIPKNAKNVKNAEKFLLYMSSKEVQYELNSQMGMISPNKHTQKSKDIFIQAGREILEEAKGLSGFYDRDTSPEMFNPGMDAMIEFMKNTDGMNKVLEKMEKARTDAFKVN